MFGKLGNLFSGKALPQKPEWKEIVNLMHDKELDCYSDRVVKVAFSRDNTRRFLMFCNSRGSFFYLIEYLYEFDDAEWAHIARRKDALPATWTAEAGSTHCSFYDTEDEAWNAFLQSTAYQQYFA